MMIFLKFSNFQMKNDPRSYDRNFNNCVKKPEKNSGPQRGLNPWPRDTGATLKYVRFPLIYTTFVAWKYWFKLTDFRSFLALYSSVFFLCDLNRTIIGLAIWRLFRGPIRWQMSISEGDMTVHVDDFSSLTTLISISSSAISAIPWISKLCFLYTVPRHLLGLSSFQDLRRGCQHLLLPRWEVFQATTLYL